MSPTAPTTPTPTPSLTPPAPPSASLNSLSSVSETVPPGWRHELGRRGPPMKGRRRVRPPGGRGGRRNSGLGSGCSVPGGEEEWAVEGPSIAHQDTGRIDIFCTGARITLVVIASFTSCWLLM